jgi:hypothetical protein
MPIVATSGPLIFGDDSTVPTIFPPPTTPSPSYDEPYYESPIISPGSSDFVATHQFFIEQIDNLNSCFKREQIVNLNDQQFEDHIQIAKIDKYIVQKDDMYCSTQGVKNLSDKLKRFID